MPFFQGCQYSKVVINRILYLLDFYEWSWGLCSLIVLKCCGKLGWQASVNFNAGDRFGSHDPRDMTLLNAACERDTFPSACCRFLPFFCFSNNFFFLVWSPPPTTFPLLMRTSFLYALIRSLAMILEGNRDDSDSREHNNYFMTSYQLTFLQS